MARRSQENVSRFPTDSSECISSGNGRRNTSTCSSNSNKVSQKQRRKFDITRISIMLVVLGKNTNIYRLLF